MTRFWFANKDGESNHLSRAESPTLFTNDATLEHAVIEEEGAQDAGHDDDEHGAEDEKEILVKVKLVLGVDDGSLLSAGVCPHNRMIFHFNSKNSSRSSLAFDSV